MPSLATEAESIAEAEGGGRQRAGTRTTGTRPLQWLLQRSRTEVGAVCNARSGNDAGSQRREIDGGTRGGTRRKHSDKAEGRSAKALSEQRTHHPNIGRPPVAKQA